jgi:hypothetical protein
MKGADLMKPWIENELKGCEFPDVRLGKRFKTIIGQLATGIGRTLPLACQDWANTKAAYRFLDNRRISEAEILEGHFQATHERFTASSGTILVLHDTTEFTFRREHTEAIGKMYKTLAGQKRPGRPRFHTVGGLLMHGSLVVTTEGLPLGLANVKFWTRKRFKGSRALARKFNATRIPIEKKESIRWIESLKQSTERLANPNRCVHIGDRESDIYELFCASEAAKTHFLVRTSVNRLAGDGTHTINDEMCDERVKAIHRIQVVNRKGTKSQATLEIRYRRILVCPPIGKQKRYPCLSLTVVHARERGKPKDRDPIDWKLITDLPVTNRREVIEKLDWYAMRWKIETFHKVMKSGCKAEESKLRTAGRLTNLMAIFCIIAWRVFWLCTINRISPNSTAKNVFTKTEMGILDHLVPVKDKSNTIKKYLTLVAKLGGYLGRSHDPPPGNMVLWRGFQRFTDIHLGFSIAQSYG